MNPLLIATALAGPGHRRFGQILATSERMVRLLSDPTAMVLRLLAMVQRLLAMVQRYGPAAIHAEAQVIVTRNLRDLPTEKLRLWGVGAQHADDFLAGLHLDRLDALGGIVAEIAWGDGAGHGEVLDPLVIDAPDTVALVRQAVGDRG